MSRLTIESGHVAGLISVRLLEQDRFDASRELNRLMVDTFDLVVREALIEMGWTPPPDPVSVAHATETPSHSQPD